MTAHRWLLLLGSNLADDSRVRDALQRLAGIGAITSLTPIQRFPSHDDRAGEYFNVLAELVHDGDRAVLIAQLKQMEDAIGRRHDESGIVAIDMDILAMHDGHAWIADAHAQAKGEFHRASVRALLQAGGQQVAESSVG